MNYSCPHCGERHARGTERCPATGRPVLGDPSLVDRTLAQRYHLLRLLGDGGMGGVYKAADQVLRRFVAVKILHSAAAENPRSVARFEREARSSAAIGHPNIIDVLDFGRAGTEIPHVREGTPFLVMEYLRGRSLAHAITRSGPMDITRACRIASHTLAGLSAAHARGILHRDLKPANLMLVPHLGDRDFVKICDFGFAALLLPSEPIDDGKALTPERIIVGTPAYAAPERLRGDQRKRDPRIDLYGVGVLLFEMLTGRRPFDAPTIRKLAERVRNEPAPALHRIRPDIPTGLSEVVTRALAKDPKERWESADELADALVPFGGQPVPEEDEPTETFSMELIRIPGAERDGIRIDSLLSGESSTAGETGETTVPDTRRAYAGVVIHSVVAYVQQRFGQHGWRSLLEALSIQAQDTLSRDLSNESWIDEHIFTALLEEADRILGNGDLQLLVACGRAIGQHPSIRMPRQPVLDGVNRLPSVATRLVRGAEYRVLRSGQGFARLELREQGTPSLLLCVTMIGFLEQSLRQLGAVQAEVTLLSSRALGDTGSRFSLSWLE
ncbi:MAG: serine/threonine-protein kinase [Myxococcota bacterium]